MDEFIDGLIIKWTIGDGGETGHWGCAFEGDILPPASSSPCLTLLFGLCKVNSLLGHMILLL
jgi:hypothetical protein